MILPYLTDVYFCQPRVWRSDMHRTKIDLMRAVEPYNGNVSMNEDREFKRDAAIEVVNPHRLRPLLDYFMIELLVTTPQEVTTTVPLGHYAVLPGGISMAPDGITGTIYGVDATYMLAQATFSSPYVVPVGVDRGAAAREVLIDYGIQPAGIDIPDAGVLTTEEVRGEEGDSRLDLVKKLLEGAGMYTPWTDGYGIIVSRHYQNIDTAQPTILFGQRSGLRILDNIEGEPDWDRLRNQVTYRKMVPGEEVIAMTATIDDRSNPYHPETWRDTIGANEPQIRGIEFEDQTLPDDPVIGRIVAYIKARSELAKRSSYYLPVRMEAIVDAHPSAHQIVGVDARYADLDWSGNWWRRAWDVTLDGPSASIVMDVNRTVGVG